jgi:hypothetical protein
MIVVLALLFRAFLRPGLLAAARTRPTKTGPGRCAASRAPAGWPGPGRWASRRAKHFGGGGLRSWLIRLACQGSYAASAVTVGSDARAKSGYQR